MSSEPPIKQSDTTFETINQMVWKHLCDRDWDGLPPRGIATSIALEAAELLEHYQWRDEPIGTKDELAAELADVFIYCFEFAQAMDIDIAEAITSKLARIAQKYPAQAFKGKTDKEKKAAWLAAHHGARAAQQHTSKK